MPLPVLQPRPPAPRVALRPHPYLHFGDDAVYNPLSDRTLRPDDVGFTELRDLVRGETAVADLPREVVAALRSGEWILPEDVDPSTGFLLKYVSIEATIRCNQACFFCPVSVSPREDFTMPLEEYDRILAQVAKYRDTIQGVFMISYNEPTADPRFVERVGRIRAHGLPPAVLTNGTGLTPARVDQLLEGGGLAFLSVNLSTLDRERYRRERAADHLPLVLRNLDYVKDRPLAREMHIAVLGTGDAKHREDYRAIAARFAGSRFDVKYYEVNDRAGSLQVGHPASGLGRKRLCGCDYVGSRPLQHLHVTPRGKVILCCQDYHEQHVVGDLAEQSIEEVLRGEEMAKLRRWTYGLEEAPEDFLCRSCSNALWI